MIGSTDSTRSTFLYRNVVRLAISAKMRPRPVQALAHSTARSSVFHATPQRVEPTTQPMPQIFCVNRRLKKAVADSASWASWTAEIRMRKTGKNVNTPTSVATATTLPATNASPLK